MWVLPLLVFASASLGGCTEECQESPLDNIGLRLVNLSDQPYAIEVYMSIWGSPREFSEQMTGSNGGYATSIRGCEDVNGEVPEQWSGTVRVREPKDHHVWAPERMGDEMVFEGNWTGIRCKGTYVFTYNGPHDVSFYERVPCSGEGDPSPYLGEKLRELERVPA